MADQALDIQILKEAEGISFTAEAMYLINWTRLFYSGEQGETKTNPIYKHDITVTADMVDGNGHVNNVVYIQWMQDAAVHHAQVSGCTQASLALGATWVVRTHHVEYLRPAFAGDTITVLTWVANFRKVHSLRKYKFIRAGNEAVVAQAETDWVFVDAKSGRPRMIPDEIKKTLPVVSKEREP